MKRAIVVALGVGAVVTSAAALGLGAGARDGASLDRARYETMVSLADDDRRLHTARCDAYRDNARELCRTEAAVAASVRIADLEADFHRTQEASRAAQRARIDARYQLDRARCQAQSGFKRDKCLIQAHAAKGRALLDAAAPYEVRYQ
jgi:hypothetical protein